MKHNKILTFLTSLALAALLLSALPKAAAAKRVAPPPAPSDMFISTPAPLNLGDAFTVHARLRDGKGKPLSDRAINFYIDFNYIGQARTDSSGAVIHRSTRKLPAGEHVLTARFAGAHDLQPASFTRKLVVRPTVVEVQTVPPLSGVSYTMDNREFVSGEDGIARITMYQVGRFELRANPEKFKSPNTRLEFGRWSQESYLPVREVDVPSKDPIQAGINVFHRIGHTFVDPDGNPVDMARISKITIRSIHGDVFTNENGAMRWVPASRVARRANGLEVTPLQYSVMNVTVDGSNVVNQAQQRFLIEPEEVFPVELLLYTMHIATHDALLGSPVGKDVQVEFPNGEVHSYPLDPTGKVEIRSLARGIYRIKILGVSGMISPTPVALSRDQEVDVKILTSVDMSMAGVAGLIVAIGLLLLGRPWLLRRMMRNRQAAPDLEPQAEGYINLHNN